MFFLPQKLLLFLSDLILELLKGRDSFELVGHAAYGEVSRKAPRFSLECCSPKDHQESSHGIVYICAIYIYIHIYIYICIYICRCPFF